MSATIELSWLSLVIAAGLVAIAGMVSIALRLGLEKRLAIAAVRTVVQLLLLGYVLKWVFGVDSPWALAPVLGVMFFTASRAAVNRASRRYRRAQLDAFITLMLCGLVTVALVTRVIVGVTPWYNAQYVIPLLGMILGNSLTGISLCLDQLLEQFSENRALIEMELMHGATRNEASRDSLRKAVQRGMIPIINSMMVVGLVSLPGMMTGQILAGNPPLQAVQYQIVVMFMIAAATSMGCIGVALIARHRLFNDRHQLLSERIIASD
jgi:putative ABC transport system permease protein